MEAACDFLAAVTDWARERSDVAGLALVGSRARGTATEESDIDLVLLTTEPGRYLDDTGWVATFGRVTGQEIELWGVVRSLRVWYADGPEVEFGIASPEWAALPADPGTLRVVADGMVILFEREGLLSGLRQ